MPSHHQRPGLAPLALALILAFAGAGAGAQVTEPAAAEKDVKEDFQNSALDAPQFYELLLGEMELREGQVGTAYQRFLETARRSKDSSLFKRVVGIALRARAGDEALTAARDWADAVPDSAEAHQTTLQLLAVLNRPTESGAVLKRWLAAAPAADRNGILSSVPGLFQRSPQAQKVLEAMQPTLRHAAEQADTRVAALSTHARLALKANDAPLALKLASEALRESAQAEDALSVALEVLPQLPEAETLVLAAIKADPDRAPLRLAYGRALARAQRIAEAAEQFRYLTQHQPDLPTAWFALGSLELELQHAEAAEAALKTFLTRLEAVGKGDSDLTDEGRDARDQAQMLLARTAEQRRDFKAAEQWLAQVKSPSRQLELHYRRASLLLKQGQLDKARALIQSLPGERNEDLRARAMAESQLLREAQKWQLAYEVLKKAAETLSDDADILYEQSMMAEKLGRNEEMETLLRKVMSIKPEHFHAYNALGYSLADRSERLDEARELVAKALSFAPREPFILDSMGWVEYRQGKLDEAVKYLRQAYNSRPDAEIAAHLGEVLWVQGQRDEAQKVWAEGARRDPRNEALRETLQRLKAKPPAP